MKYFTEPLGDRASPLGFRSGNALNIARKGANKVEGGRSGASATAFFVRRLSTRQSHLEGRQRNEATFAESEWTWLALAPLQGKSICGAKANKPARFTTAAVAKARINQAGFCKTRLGIDLCEKGLLNKGN